MVQRLDELLQICTVKITVPDHTGWGTGFYVAPGLILTCAHVVKAFQPGTTAQIAWQQQEEFAQAAVIERMSELDLALLQFSPPANVKLPCVYLGEAFQPQDDLYTFGYPDSFPQGTSVTGLCEGSAVENNSPLIVFKSAQVRPGLSGSPLLNLNTGNVCGIVKFTRDRSIDLGGGAIPATVIFEQFPALREQQRQFHGVDRRWSDLLESETVDFSDLLARIEAGVATNADLQKLRNVLAIRSSQIVQLGKYINIGTEQDIQIGDRTYVEINEAAVHAIVAAIQASASPASQSISSKYGMPFPKVRLPENFVERPDALKAVKAKLLAEDDRMLVVSAISGLGGLGKSVLATALVLDAEVQARFADGILWVTLGQNPNLQTMLGEWIRELDKSREAFSANTLESASRYLHSLLVERRVLLVVDDVWNAAHAEWFRVGGAGCRVLVTTREAQIEGAEYYPLNLMSESEAIELVRQKLKQQWRSEQEAEVKAFAKMLGYLPLALDLAANQVQDGLTWAELRSEFEVERRSVALEVLDQSEAWEQLDEEQQRKYSLRACFNLSLRRLQPEQLRQFSWLGVLPEDVNLEARVASVLWDLPLLKAKKGLIDLRRRSFLTDGVATSEGERTYRVHDLMHDMARGLIEAGTLNSELQTLNSKIQNPLSLAHRQFLERYCERAAARRWDELPNDGYIHRHLTWHMEQADWVDEVHALMAMSDERGRNAWFEACDRIGQPAIFVEDIARGWRLAEQGYQQDSSGSIVLQCRYALIMATLNSLIENLPIDMIAEFVRQNFWTVEQAWACVEQMQGEWGIGDAIQVLAPYLSKPLLQVALGKTRSIQNQYQRAKVLSSLAEIDRAYFTEALETARSMQNQYWRAEVLEHLAQIAGADFTALLEFARSLQEEFWRAKVLSSLAQIDGADFAALLKAARSLRSECLRAEVLSSLAEIDSAYFTEALETARSIQHEYWLQARVLSSLAQIDGAYFTEALESARLIQHEYRRAEVLSSLIQVDGADFAALLEAARAIQEEHPRAEVLSSLAQIDGAYFTEALESARLIQDEHRRAEVLSSLAQIGGADFAALLEAACAIQDKYKRAKVLSSLVQIDGADFTALLEAVRSLQDERWWAKVLSSLAQIDRAYFAKALEAIRSIQSGQRGEVLGRLARVDGADFVALLEVARSIQDEYSWAGVLSRLAQIDRAYFTEALEAARLIQDERRRAEELSRLAQIDRAYFMEALEAARSMQNKYDQTEVLSSLARIDGADSVALLEAICANQNEYWRTGVLSRLAQIDRAYFMEALEAARSLQEEDKRARVLSRLAQIDRAYFTEALEVVRSLQEEDKRAEGLSRLAQIDRAYFTEALEATHLVQEEYNRAWLLSRLAQIDSTYFTEALEAARSLRLDLHRAKRLSDLAQIDGADFTVLLEAACLVQEEYSRAEVLSSLVQQAPQDFLPKLWKAILDFTHKPTRAKALSGSLPSFPLATLPHSDWQTYLHLLAHHKRSDLMQDFVILYPAIVYLGGEAAMREVVATMREICSQWK
jgi:hypothetical protein